MKINLFRKTHFKSSGFTLVELIIVLLILGVLASIIVPKISNYVEDAKSVGTFAQLKNIRSAFELYRTQHNNDYPTLAQLQSEWGVLLKKTALDGNISTDAKYGPYLQQPPRNPWTESYEVILMSNPGDMTDGWRYEEGAGDITPVGFDEGSGTFVTP